jgi:hypothetical protein
MFLGAGASLPPPTGLPPFVPLSRGVLKAMGWERETSPDATPPRWRYTGIPAYPDITNFDGAPEVLFGTLRMFGVSFASEVARVLGRAEPNAVHDVAAAVLEAGGCVWTPNVDLAVEEACRRRGLDLHRTGRRVERRARTSNSKSALANSPLSPLSPLSETSTGTYVKFHGTVEAPNTLAFTDRELIAPLPDEIVGTLAGLARDRIVVFYGYAGADADLAELIDAVIEKAREVYWFEPSSWNRTLIGQAFPKHAARIQFVPRTEAGSANIFRDLATNFLQLCAAHGYSPGDELARQLVEGGSYPDDPKISLPPLSGATQARLVQRFGANDPDDEKIAWGMAFKSDLRHLRLRAIPAHLRHRISYSLYHSGPVSVLVGRLAQHRQTLERVQPPALRNYLITRASALLLTGRDWEKLRDFTDWAVNLRSRAGKPHPSDNYYRAQAYRYSLQPAQARRSAEEAIAGLEDLSDPERLAGALYEAGEAAIYQADFTAALDYAFQLRQRRGRYAIPRWQAWGSWLELIALAHLGCVDEALDVGAGSAMTTMISRFNFERDPLNRADARTAELLVARVRLFRSGDSGLDQLSHDTDGARRRRYKDDLDLLKADFAIAEHDHDTARTLLTSVRDNTRVPIARHCARRGLAELDRLDGLIQAASDAFTELAEEAHAVGAVWYEAQAVLGLQLCEDARAEALWDKVQEHWPNDGGVCLDDVKATKDRPARPLWLLTV